MTKQATARLMDLNSYRQGARPIPMTFKEADYAKASAWFLSRNPSVKGA